MGAEPNKIKSPEGTFKVVPGGEGFFAGDTRNVAGCISNSASKDSKPIKKMMNDVEVPVTGRLEPVSQGV